MLFYISLFGYLEEHFLFFSLSKHSQPLKIQHFLFCLLLAAISRIFLLLFLLSVYCIFSCKYNFIVILLFFKRLLHVFFIVLYGFPFILAKRASCNICEKFKFIFNASSFSHSGIDNVFLTAFVLILFLYAK